jgi:ATP-dependent DNA helicase 2 subunit 2
MKKNYEKIKYQIIDEINNNDVKINVIAIDFFHEIEEEEGMDVEGAKKETKNQIKTKEVLKDLSEETENVKIFTSRMAESIYKQFKKKKISPVTKFRGPLIITPNLYIDVAVYTKTSKVDIPSLKKQSLAVEYDEMDIKKGAIENERVFYVHDDPDQTPLSKEFITKAYYYGKSLVPVNSTDEVLFKNTEARCFRTIGFSDNFRVPRHQYMSGSDLVIPNPQSEEDVKAFTAIVKEMISMNKVIIARYVPRQNAEPKLVVLSPHMSKKGAVLYLNVLPTVEDLRDYQFESLKECTAKQEEVVSKFIDSLDLEHEEGEEEKEEKLKPTETFNPVLQYFYDCLEHKALKSDNNLPPLDDTISDYLKPDRKLFENNKYVTFLPKMFEIKESKNIIFNLIRRKERR